MARMWIIVPLLMLGSAVAANGMDHAGHEGHRSEHAQPSTHEATMVHSGTVDLAGTHDTCIADADQRHSMPMHGTCLGCCPGESGASDGVTVDRRIGAPALVIELQPHIAGSDREAEPPVPSAPNFSPPHAPTVLRL